MTGFIDRHHVGERTARIDADPIPALAHSFSFWGPVPLRTSALIFASGNFVFSGIYLVFVGIAKRAELSPAAIGALIAVFGGASLAGALLVPRIARRLSMRAIMLGNEC